MPGFWARPGAPSLFAPQRRQGQMCRKGGKPEIGSDPQAKTHFVRKEFITQNLALIFQFFARSLLLPTPNERRDQMCQVFGLARARGARKPGTFAPSLLAPQQRQGQMCRNRREPRDRPRPQSKTHFLRKEFITQNLALIFQILPAPSSFLLLPTPNEWRDQMCQVFGLARARAARKPGTFAPSLLAPQQRQGHMCRNGVEGTPRSAPTPIKNALFTKRIYHSKSGPDNFCQLPPLSSSSLHPMNGETKCARFWGSPGPAGPDNLAHLLLPSLHHSNGKAKCAGMGGNPRSAPTPIKNALFTKRRFHSKSGPDFSIFARSLLLPLPPYTQ